MTSGFAMTSSHFNGKATAALHGEKVPVDEGMSAAHKFWNIVGESAALPTIVPANGRKCPSVST
jgi:hypothetical protein